MADTPAALGDDRSLGILGGTFNPPHLGHLTIASAARAQLGLERVVLMPARIPPHKPEHREPGAGQRLRMCALLSQGVEGLSACALELEREGPSYTVDTLQAIHASHPEVELTFIAGADIARTLPSWREPAALLALARLAVAARAGTERREVLDAVAALGDAERVRFLDAPLVGISSSIVRERAAAGAPIEKLVGPALAGYIVEQGLYGVGVRAGD